MTSGTPPPSEASTPSPRPTPGRSARLLGSAQARIWMICLLVLVGLSALYFVDFREARASYLTDRYFRALDVTARDVRERVLHFRHILYAYQSKELGARRTERAVQKHHALEGRLAEIESGFSEIEARRRSGPLRPLEARELDFLEARLKDRRDRARRELREASQILEVVDRKPPGRSAHAESLEREEADPAAHDGNFKRVAALARLDIRLEPSVPPLERCPRSSKTRPMPTALELGRDEPYLVIDYPGCANDAELDDPYAPIDSLRARLPLADLIDASRVPGAFDHLLLANRQGEIIYASEGGFLSFRSLNAMRGPLLEDAGSGGQARQPLDPETLRAQSDGRLVEIAGNVYKAFSTPLHLIQRATGGSHGAGTEDGDGSWVLVGLVNESRFRSDLLSFPLNLVAVLLLALVLAVLAWPYLKLHYLGPGERVRGSDYLYLGMSALLGTALLSLAFFDTIAFMGLRGELDEIAEQVSDQMIEDVGEELLASRAYLVNCSRMRVARQEPAYRGPGCPDERGDAASGGLQEFELLFWLDEDGTAATGAPPVNRRARHVGDLRVPDRTYFKRALAGQLWSVRRSFRADGAWVPEAATPVPARGSLPGPGIYVERIRVRDEGTKLTAISTNWGEAGRPPVAVLVKRMESLFSPVLPPTYSFAIIDGAGQVQYHSDDSRSLVENLFEEADTGRRLEAAVAARARESLQGTYHGRSHAFLVKPIPNLPWSLVVLRDRTFLEAANFHLLLTCGLALGIYALLYLVAALVLGRTVPGFRGAWFWPLPRPGAEYRRIPLALVLLIGFYVLAIFALGSWGRVMLVLAVPPLAISFLFLSLHAPVASRSLPWKVSRGIQILSAVVVGGAVLFASERHDAVWWGSLVALLVTLGAMGHCERLKREVPQDLFHTTVRGGPYSTVVMLTFVLLAVLPALAVFTDTAFERRDSITKLAQIELAQTLERRADRVRQEIWRVTGERPSQPIRIGGVHAAEGRRWGVYGSDLLVVYCKETALHAQPEVVCEKFIDWLQPIEPPDLRTATSYVRDGIGPLLAGILPVYSPAAQRVRQLDADSGDGSAEWRWVELVARGAGANGPVQRGLQLSYHRGLSYEVVSRPLPISWPRDLAGLIAVCAAGAAFLLYALGIVTSVGSRLFGSEITSPRPPDDDVSHHDWASVSSFVVRPSEGFRRDLESRLRRLGRLHRGEADPEAEADERPIRTLWLDLGALIHTRPAASWLDARERAAEIFVLEGVEERLDAPETTRELLTFLEGLVIEERKVVHILALTEPRRWPTRLREAPEEEETRGAPRAEWARKIAQWERFLARFRLIRPGGWVRADAWKQVSNRSIAVLMRECAWAPELQVLEKELAAQQRFRGDTLEEDQVVELVRERAQATFRRVWNFSSRAEKLALHQMADGAMANPKNADVLASLVQRGLVIRDPDFGLASESLRRFVCKAEAPERFAAWEKSVAEGSEWRIRRLPFLLLITLAGGAILYSQADALESTVALLTGVFAGLPMLMQASSLLLRAGRSASAIAD